VPSVNRRAELEVRSALYVRQRSGTPRAGIGVRLAEVLGKWLRWVTGAGKSCL
jgi:hypothetical protein